MNKTRRRGGLTQCGSKPLGRVQGKTIIVTGGGLGIGRETCLLLAAEGARVAVTDILDEAGDEVVRQAGSRGVTARFWHLVVTDEAEVERVFAEVRDTFGGVDVLVNNAGISGPDKPTTSIRSRSGGASHNRERRRRLPLHAGGNPLMRERRGGSISTMSLHLRLVGALIFRLSRLQGALRLMTKTDALFYAPRRNPVNSVHRGLSGRRSSRSWPCGRPRARGLPRASRKLAPARASRHRRRTWPTGFSTSRRMKPSS